MKDPFLIIWAGLLFASIFWYGFLVIYLGIRAGREIRAMAGTLRAAADKKRRGPGQ